MTQNITPNSPTGNSAGLADVELAMVGAALSDRNGAQNYLVAAGAGLRAEHFSVPLLEAMWRAIVDLTAAGRPASPFTLRPLFESDPAMAAAGGMKFFAHAAAQSASIRDIAGYAAYIVDWSNRRRIMQLGETLMGSALDPGVAIPDMIAAMETAGADCAAGNDRGIRPIDAALEEAMNQAEAAFQGGGSGGATVGIAAADHIVCGMGPGDLIVLAGRPGMGKSALAGHIALHNAMAGQATVVFSLEMSSAQWASRYLSQLSKLSTDRLRRGNLNKMEFERLIDAAEGLKRAPLFIDETPALTPAAMRARCKRFAVKKPLGLIVVDYLQLLQPSSGRRENRVQDVAEISAGLKAMAKELNVPVVALSQLSRAVELRPDKRPQLSDLRDSGSIEQDADMVLFIYRESYYVDRREAPGGSKDFDDWAARCDSARGRAELIVAKNRHGRCETAIVGFDADLARFKDWGAPL